MMMQALMSSGILLNGLTTLTKIIKILLGLLWIFPASSKAIPKVCLKASKVDNVLQ